LNKILMNNAISRFLCGGPTGAPARRAGLRGPPGLPGVIRSIRVGVHGRGPTSASGH